MLLLLFIYMRYVHYYRSIRIVGSCWTGYELHMLYGCSSYIQYFLPQARPTSQDWKSSQLEIILTAKFRSGDCVINFFFYNHRETLRDQRRQQDGSEETKSPLTTV